MVPLIQHIALEASFETPVDWQPNAVRLVDQDLPAHVADGVPEHPLRKWMDIARPVCMDRRLAEQE
jgi:hypothetical protein